MAGPIWLGFVPFVLLAPFDIFVPSFIFVPPSSPLPLRSHSSLCLRKAVPQRHGAENLNAKPLSILLYYQIVMVEIRLDVATYY